MATELIAMEKDMNQTIKMIEALEHVAKHSDSEHWDTLNAVGAELLRLDAALRWIAVRCPAHLMDQPLHVIHKEMAHDAGACARAAIAEMERP